MKEIINISKNNYGSKIVFSKISKIEYNQKNDSPSVKMVLSGIEKYVINGRPYALSENRFLVVDNNSDVQLNIDAKKEVKGICIFPSKRLLNEVAKTRVSSAETLLDDPFKDYNQKLTHSLFSFTETRTGRFLNQNIAKILDAFKDENSMDFESFYLQLGECVVYDQLELEGKLKAVPSVKKSTQEELYRRIATAKDFMVDNFRQNIVLDDLAQEASLSKFHFTRTFKSLFHLSPYQFLTQLRLGKAKELIQLGYSYNEVSLLVGFSDGNNLRKALKKMGSSPN
ncbi:MAG TPA: AraC family transcriptional regulator [Flavobacteriaceae bacterium]|nr:AraC family transcriptional regulator [Flavobacteriaceae bacterium]